ncbi:hypothetical protein [Lysobacter brunescens]
MAIEPRASSRFEPKDRAMSTSTENADYLIKQAMQAGITNPRELAIFMGQMQVECGGFRSMHEGLNYSPERLLQVFGP